MNSDPSRLPNQGKSHEAAETVVLDWWRRSIANEKAPTGPRAELRRAKTLEEVVFVPLFHELRFALTATPWRAISRLALAAGVLANVHEHDTSRPFAAQMAAPRPGASHGPVVSPSRFRRLLRLGETPEELEQLFQLSRRVVALLDNKANVTDLARSLFWWNAKTRKRWAIEYYDHVNERSLRNE